MTETPRRGAPKDTPCPKCGVLFAKNNLPMHLAGKHADGTPPSGSAPERKPASRSRAAGAPASPPAETPPAKKPYDVLDSSTW
jgi:hypothetical protein